MIAFSVQIVAGIAGPVPVKLLDPDPPELHGCKAGT